MEASEERQSGLRREIGLRDLVLFNIAAVIGIRWLAAAAHAGPGSISLWLLAALLFFVPSALAISMLSRYFPEEGGLYIWTKRSFGDWHGFVAGWCFWLSNLFYFPNLALAGVAMGVYALGSQHTHLASNRGFVLSASLVLLWAALLSHLFGLRIGKWTQNIGGLSTYAAGGLIIAAGAVIWATHGAATPIEVVPEWNWDKVNFWSQIAFAFGGLELGAVMGGEIRNPKRNVPRAAWISGSAICVFYIAGTLAILALLVPEKVSVLSGLAQAGQAASERAGLTWFSPLLAGLITLGVVGQLGAWVGGSARVPFAIGLDRYLPPALGKLHPRWGTPYVSLLAQGGTCTGFILLLQSGEELELAYQLLVDMTIITYFIPFVYVFLSAWRQGQRLGPACGLSVTIAAILLSLVPPADVASVWWFEVKLAGGCLLLLLVGRLAFLKGIRYQRSQAL
ncbi:MAG: APC family permease [Bryobacteraceae bacterium]|nr:APC family permease [Bryobacterales bacterium]MEB2363056.1 APC family permease [Bryobacterales bacterium]NUM99594.1 APC family permease [Bryobacteraceae bacterium]